jgi:hypothetical protein
MEDEHIDEVEPQEIDEEVEDPKIAKRKALYQARLVLLHGGTPGERMACGKAMKKMEKKYGLNKVQKTLSKKRKNMRKMKCN